MIVHIAAMLAATAVRPLPISTGKRTLLLRQNGKTLRGIDGVARCGPSLHCSLQRQSG